MAFHMADKLSELKHQGYQSHRLEDFPPDGDSEEEKSAEEMEGFFQTIDELGKSINEIALRVDNIHRNQVVILSPQPSQVTTEAKDENTKLMNEVKSLSKRVHAGLKRLKAEVEEGESGQERITADFRIKKAQYTTLSRRFRDVMGNYNSIQEDYRDRNKERIQRQLKICEKEKTDTQVEEMLESDNPNVFAQDVLVDTAQKRQALDEVEARHREILHLEENIRELHEMFYDMALLVEEQGELIDQIEHNVETAAIHVDQGRKEIRKAVTYQRKVRSKKVWICCIVSSCLIVTLIVIAIIIVVVVCSGGGC